MKFTEVTLEDIRKMDEKERRERGSVKQALLEFIASGYDYAKAEDEWYNNNNDLRRAIQSCIEINELPLMVFMRNGITYVGRLE